MNDDIQTYAGTWGKFELLSAAYHRNGSSGQGFYIGQVAYVTGEYQTRIFQIVVVPDTDKDGEPNFSTHWENIFAVDLHQAANGDIAFGTNSWRGDQLQAEARIIVQEG